VFLWYLGSSLTSCLTIDMTIGRIIDVVAALEIQLLNIIIYLEFWNPKFSILIHKKSKVAHIDKKAVTDIMPKSTHLGLEPTSMHALRAIFLCSP